MPLSLKTDNQGIYQIFADTLQSPAIFVNGSFCFWRRQISNGDVIWDRQSTGSCTPSFEIDNSSESIRYIRNILNCQYIDDEEPYEILSNAQDEDELLKFDKSLISLEQQSIVFMEVHQYVFRQH
ncbi:unnamed protein product [Rotaria sordida]|uniref:Uncharacterized protein n=1 Tax=Rotaria sordida TaxID=392033 RepID=A0A815AI52_9BILA|nr:unnamed protein product [Rotaria sordida]